MEGTERKQRQVPEIDHILFKQNREKMIERRQRILERRRKAENEDQGINNDNKE